jgi:hypothetical protein
MLGLRNELPICAVINTKSIKSYKKHEGIKKL